MTNKVKPDQDPLWYKDAVIYQIHIKAFRDGDGDGTGDLKGLIEKLDYIQDLGVTAIWLLPFYPSPFRDDGYDISDYRKIHPQYGSMRDFRRFVHLAHDRGLKVITELVVNHTSDQHPWFQRAKKAKAGSWQRDFYVWSDNDETKYQDARIIFLDSETSNWAWDQEAQAYYWHRFYHHQPDLNFANPRVIREVFNIMRFWLDSGVDGLRLDAIPYLCERDGTNCENLPETHAVVRQLRSAIDEQYQGRMLLAEANQWPEDVRPYFGDGDECHMVFHFPLMPRMYMSVAREDRHPIIDIMRQTPEIPESCQWAVFLRNHDELTLEMVTDQERDYLWQFYAKDPQARINLGIRRRLAPLMDNDRRKIELMNSLLMSMPGTPVIYYGDEIGMGDNFYLGDRNSVRTPMQWSPDRNAGFSSTDPQRLYLPPIMDPVYGYGAVNVESASRNSSSLLNWTKRLVKQHQARRRTFGRGSIKFLYPSNRKILAYLREYEGETILCVANLSRSAQPVGLDLSEYRGRTPVELLGKAPFPPIGDLYYLLTLPPYGFYWFLLADVAEAPVWAESAVPLLPELSTLVVDHGWKTIQHGRGLARLESEVLRSYIERQRWFMSRGTRITGTDLKGRFEFGAGSGSWLVSTVAVHLAGGRTENYFLPLALDWEAETHDPMLSNLANVLARVRTGPRVGALIEALSDSGFARAITAGIGEGREVPGEAGKLRFWRSEAYTEPEDASELPIQPLAEEQSNTSLRVGQHMILKAFRGLEAGVHPEVEMGQFLTEVAKYRNTPQLLGAVEHIDSRGRPTTLCMLQEFVQNQGSAWSFTLNHLERFLDELSTTEHPPPDGEVHGAYAGLAEQLGTRVGELHYALATSPDHAAFSSEPLTQRDVRGWKRQLRKEVRGTFAELRRRLKDLEPPQREVARGLLQRRKQVLAWIDSLELESGQTSKTRFHGDLHLSQILVVKNDFYIIDFEGEARRSFAERRSKDSPLKDVAGLLRSLHYAGWTALMHVAQEKHEEAARLEPAIADWESAAASGFLRGYCEAVKGCPVCPSQPEALRRLLDLFCLHRMCYELRDELANRPTWVSIPCRAICALLSRYESDANAGA